MDMAKELGGLTESEKIETNKIYGCTSQAWVVGAENIDGTFSFKTDSDAMIVKGLLGLLEKIFNGQNSENILLIQSSDILDSIGLVGAVKNQRTYGFSSAIEKIKGLVK
jgi:cysteine desulfuration protein SufE